MRCPFCQGNDTSVVDTRPLANEPCVRRRRECPDCHQRFSTRERVEWNLPQVEKRDGKLENFDHDKLAQGILTAIKKRDIASDDVEKAIDEIEHSLAQTKMDKITSTEIGSLVLKKLFLIDQVAALRFASVYLRFDDLTSFNNLIERLRAMPSPGATRTQYPLMDENEEG